MSGVATGGGPARPRPPPSYGGGGRGAAQSRVTVFQTSSWTGLAS